MYSEVAVDCVRGYIMKGLMVLTLGIVALCELLGGAVTLIVCPDEEDIAVSFVRLFMAFLLAVIDFCYALF